MILGPALGHRAWSILRDRFKTLPDELDALAPWIHGLGLPYLAIILGSVSSRHVGLQGFPVESWATGGLACVAGLAAGYLVIRQREIYVDPDAGIATLLLEEGRWAFYRGAARLWLPFPFSTLLGLGMSMIEMGITHFVVSDQQKPSTAQWKLLLRAALSTTLFATTQNFWLTLGTQLLLHSPMFNRLRVQEEASRSV
jgi:hypothetical protein